MNGFNACGGVMVQNSRAVQLLNLAGRLLGENQDEDQVLPFLLALAMSANVGSVCTRVRNPHDQDYSKVMASSTKTQSL